MSPYLYRFHGQSDNGAENDHSQNRITRVPRPPYQRMGEETELDPWRLFEDRVRTGPFGLSRFPLQPFSPARILVLSGGSTNNNNNRSNNNDGINPRLQRFIQNSPPRIRNEWNIWTAMEQFEPEDPGLTENEFKASMKRLKKQVYQPPKRAQGRGLFGGTRSSTNEVEVERIGEGGGRECTICLESFVPNEHVLVTPCNHTFHADCITPWVKSHGKCPICRLAFFERTESSRVPLNYNGNNSNRHVLSAGESEVGEEQLSLELLALVRAMEEAFNWVTLNSRAIPFD